MELRRNHRKNGIGGSIIKMIVFVLLLLALLFWVYSGTNDQSTVSTSMGGYELLSGSNERYNDVSYSFLPSARGEIINHQYYTLSYIEQHEQAEWVAYEMTQEMLRAPNVKRSDRFIRDSMVSTGSAGYYDYRGSGYTRGHLAPAGDMAFNSTAMQESFYMSNISPQVRAFNNGIWKELEEQVRDWTYHNDQMYIVTGPILSNDLPKIKKEKISIPKYFYKALLSPINKKGIAFVIPHEMSEVRLQNFAITIDSLEKLTSIDFYQQLDDDPKIESLESNFSLSEWKFSEARYNLRVTKWNKQ